MRSSGESLGAHRVLIEACLKHGIAFWWQGPGALLIARDNIPTVLREVTAQGYQVLGLEGFEVESTAIHPRLDLIFDASRRVEISDPSQIAMTWPSNVWIDVTLKPK